MCLKKKTAFSLVELSLVLIVIGLLIAGIYKGGRLVNAWKVTAAQNLTKGSPVNSIKDLIFWIEPTMDSSFDSNVDNGTVITNWYGNSAQGISSKINLTQASNTNRPLYKAMGIGGLPSVLFDGVDDFLYGQNLNISSSDSTIFAVFRAANGSSANDRDLLAIFYDADTNFTNNNGKNGILIEFPITTKLVRFLYRSPVGITGGDSNFSTTAITDERDYIFSSIRDLNAGKLVVRLNNTAFIGDVATTPTVSSGAFDSVPSNIVIGNLNDNSSYYRPFNGQISEVIIFDRALSQKEISDVQSYLSKKYSIKLN